MSIPNTSERKLRPTHPGEMLREGFLPEYGLTVASLAEALGVSRQTMNELLRERRAVSPEMALWPAGRHPTKGGLAGDLHAGGAGEDSGDGDDGRRR